MGFERRHAVPAGSKPIRGDLAPQLVFLHGQVPPESLRTASAIARREHVCPVRALTANGLASERRVYAALAGYLGVRFVDDWPSLGSMIDPAASVTGEVRLSGTMGRLVAPEGEALRACLRDRADLGVPGVVVTTPAHLAALANYGAQRQVAYLASEALPTVAPHLSARDVCGAPRFGVVLAVAALLGLACVAPRLVGDLFGALFFAGMIFRLLVSVAAPSRDAPDPPALRDAALPVYSVLVPLSKEADVLPDLLDALRAIDYPRAKLDVLLLIEPEDLPLRRAIAAEVLPPWVRVVFGPVGGGLRTKPRALNIGLLAARGTFVAVFDAEDRPAPDQLRRAAAHFHADTTLDCLQARLSIRDDGSVLSRLFAIEYAALFGVFNPGLAACDLPIALGGTSNHFRRVTTLRDIGGWDAWNVTEDADLGLRLARFGRRVGCFDSVTEETAPHDFWIWLKQRRRWTKGWIQTLLVLARGVPDIALRLGPLRAPAVGLLLVNLVVAPLALPPFALGVAYHLARHGLPCPHGGVELVEATLAGSVFAIGVLSPVWCGYVGLRAMRRREPVASLPLVLPYQVMISVAAWLGLWDLLRRPFHWHKTPHRAVARSLNRSSP